MSVGRSSPLARAAGLSTDPPALLISLALEGEATVELQAATPRDERRLIAWLRRTDVINDLPLAIAAHLDRLDEAAA